MKPFTALLILLVLASSAAYLTRAQEVENERDFSYDERSHIGPLHWGRIHPEWKECNSGRTQSPIDLLNKRVAVVSHLGALRRNYKQANATLVNRGHDMMIRWNGGGGHLVINGTEFELKQTHWHSPSEHTLDGKRFSMEVHLVHQSKDNRTAVIGIMYKIGGPDSFLSKIQNNLITVAQNVNSIERNIGLLHPNMIEFGSRKYYRYIGSLTTPPCTQNITWTILRKVRTVTRDQMRLIRDAVHDNKQTNARPVQLLNERTLKLFRPSTRNGGK